MTACCHAVKGSRVVTAQRTVQGQEADALYVVQSGIITCDMDFLALSTRQHLQQVSKQVTADCPDPVQHRQTGLAAWLLPLLWSAGSGPCQGLIDVPARNLLGHMLNGSRQLIQLQQILVVCLQACPRTE